MNKAEYKWCAMTIKHVLHAIPVGSNKTLCGSTIYGMTFGVSDCGRCSECVDVLLTNK